MMNKKFVNKKALVLGMGVSGRSAAEFLLAHGASVLGVDGNRSHLENHPEINDLKQKGLRVEHEEAVNGIESMDFLILSPGIPETHPLVQLAKRNNLQILGEIELGCRAANHRMIGITGTNGKTTVTLLVTHLLNQNGIPAIALGNVGNPLTKELLTIDPKTTIVLELSSYQIETLHHPCLDSAVILNITPDHLDRYSSMDQYAEAKCQIEAAVKPEGKLFIEEAAWHFFGCRHLKRPCLKVGYTKSCEIYTDLTTIFYQGKRVLDLPANLQGRVSHELENFMAAFALCVDFGFTQEQFISAWKTFKKPSHRIEFVTELKGVKYYDDSKGTNIDAVIRAVQSLDGSILLIAGGVDKGAAYTPWIEKFKEKVKLVCAIGQAAAKIEDQLGKELPVIVFNHLEEAVRYAAKEANSGDTVLLSPGCSSFDMFKDYAHRGTEFQRIVRDILKEEKIK